MALTECKECSKEISTEAATCPHCGCPAQPARKRSKGLMWLIGCLIAIPVMFVTIAVIGMIAAIAIPSFVRAKQVSRENACINNLRLIDSAKEQWALAEMKETGTQVDIAAVNEYMMGNTTPVCPQGGTYTYNPIGEDPACSVAGHEFDVY